MRLGILALFLCGGGVALCQTAAPTHKTPVPANERQRSVHPQTECKNLHSSVPSFAPQDGVPPFKVPAWCGDYAMLDGSIPSHSTPPMPKMDLNLVPFEGKFLVDQGPYQPRSQAKVEPIPTEWSNAKFEAIPTVWPDLKVVPVASEDGRPIQSR